LLRLLNQVFSSIRSFFVSAKLGKVKLKYLDKLIAIDVEAIKILLSYKARNKLLADPWQMPQIITALKHKLGAGKGDYVLLSR
jgi:hypothetical protein